MVASMYECPFFGGTSMAHFSHPYVPFPRENITFGEFCPRSFSFVPIINKWIGDDLARPKRYILTGFSCKYLVVLTGILGPSKGVRQRANHRGNARAVFNCSGVGYFAIAASAMGARGRGSSDSPVLAKTNFLDSWRSTQAYFSHPYFPSPQKTSFSARPVPDLFSLYR